MKNNGTEFVTLPISDIKQIAGRAGRYKTAADAVKKARNRGLSLGQLGRQQSWNEQDMKHMLQGRLMDHVDGTAGYDSGPEKK